MPPMLGVGRLGDVVKARIINNRVTFGGGFEDVHEARAPKNVIDAVSVAGMHGLRNSIIEAGHRHRDERLLRHQRLAGCALKRAPIIDWMNGSPRKGEKSMVITQQPQIMEPAEPINLGGSLEPE